MTAPTRVLVTGAGGPAGVAVIRRFLEDPTVDVLAADMDPYAAGLYLVGPDRRFLVPAGDADDFVDEVRRRCRIEGIDVVVPTVDSELLPLAEHRAAFADAGVRLAVTGVEPLRDTLDKAALAARSAHGRPRPRHLDVSGHRQAAPG